MIYIASGTGRHIFDCETAVGSCDWPRRIWWFLATGPVPRRSRWRTRRGARSVRWRDDL